MDINLFNMNKLGDKDFYLNDLIYSNRLWSWFVSSLFYFFLSFNLESKDRWTTSGQIIMSLSDIHPRCLDTTPLKLHYGLAFVEVCLCWLTPHVIWVPGGNVCSLLNCRSRLLGTSLLTEAHSRSHNDCAVTVLYLPACLFPRSVPHKAPRVLPCDWLMMMQCFMAEELHVLRAFQK